MKIRILLNANCRNKILRISEALFHENGRANLTIEENQTGYSRYPYSYNLSMKDAVVDGVPVKILMDLAAVP